MKIQINSLAALERLIGGDNELEIDIRKSIVEQFTKAHLRTLLNTDVVKVQMANMADKEVKSMVSQVIKASVEAKWSRAEKLIEKYVEDAAEMISDNISRSIIEKRIEKLVDERLKEKLGIK